MPNCRRFFSLIAVFLLVPGWLAAAPLGRGFTYQGKLSQGGTAVNGTVTLRFSLWDEAGSGDPPAGGSQIGSSQVLADVPVTDGIFSVELNGANEFGSAAFSGDARWLQVEVCSGGTCTASTVLGPRQAMTGAPYALGPWQLSGSSISFTGGNVGIGISTPGTRLDVRGGAIAVENLGDQADLLWFNSERSWVFRQEGTGASTALKLQNIGGGGNKNFIVQTDGLMGVGTTAPTAKLDVRGDIRLGSSGEYLAPGGSERLRIVRGTVTSSGTIWSGTGFSVSHTSTGIYYIHYTTGFPTLSPAPSVTVSPTSSSLSVFAMAVGSSWSGLYVYVRNTSGTLVNDTFHFISVGSQ